MADAQVRCWMLTKPGAAPSEICGGVQPAGMSNDTPDKRPEATNLKLKALFVVPATTSAGVTVMAPSPGVGRAANAGEAPAWIKLTTTITNLVHSQTRGARACNLPRALDRLRLLRPQPIVPALLAFG
ncbi:MAG TPA: hypothetical protein VMZ51_01680 [Acidimicrobiales bacterium]|nr:hypothetical protein [Acidimicrobiales bacterium]